MLKLDDFSAVCTGADGIDDGHGRNCVPRVDRYGTLAADGRGKGGVEGVPSAAFGCHGCAFVAASDLAPHFLRLHTPLVALARGGLSGDERVFLPIHAANSAHGVTAFGALDAVAIAGSALAPITG